MVEPLMEVEAWLKEARLEQLGQLLDGLGVECLEDSPLKLCSVMCC